MLHRNKYPLLEYDDTKDAVISPKDTTKKYSNFPSGKLVITFFKDVIKNLLSEKIIEEYLTITGENDLVIYKFIDCEIFLMHGIIGCPACGGFLDELTGLGISSVMFCGGGGVLDTNIKVGELMIVEGAIRDEGFSYHYAPPSRVIYAQKEVIEAICAYLNKNDIPHFRGLVWTTDSFYRETKDRIALRIEEGAKIVEMEQSGLIAVAQFRGIKYGAILYGGDDVSQEIWDSRSWHDKKSIRYALVKICKDLVSVI